LITGDEEKAKDEAITALDGSEDEEKSVLQSKLERLTLMISYIGMTVAVIMFVVLIMRYSIIHFAVDGNSWQRSDLSEYLHFFVIAVTILVVAIPEGLPLAVTLSLAYSIKKMLIDKNLVRHLNACETMGNATTICSDKTGTLTTNRMTVMRAWIEDQIWDPPAGAWGKVGKPTEQFFAEGVAVNSTAEILPPKEAGGQPEHTGNKTECALLQFCANAGYEYTRTRAALHPLKLNTFSSARKRMSVIVPIPGSENCRLYVKGASEIILDLCSSVITKGGSTRPMARGEQAQIRDRVIESFARDGLRTLCLAYRDLGPRSTWESQSAEEMETQLVCIAIVGIEDPVRPEVPPAIQLCQRAGVVVRMVTGDNVTTAKSIALKCGIISAHGNELVMEGPDFRRKVLDDDGNLRQAEFDKIWPHLRVLARSSPKDKYTLVSGLIASTLYKDRQVVAVTGDGTNDAPALKRADVGFAMGISGTPVAKDASDIILMDDNFNSIVQAVKWGRNVYDSIAKFLQFQLTVNVVAVLTAVIGAFALSESPLTAVQLLWINLIMDSFASLALATEPPTDALLDRKPCA
jgi:P-type Ca2+ transporter type 2B